MAHLNSLRFIEQYNPEDLKTSEQPYAYVCDQVHEVELGVDIDEVRGKGISQTAWTALTELRDKIAPAENIGWFVVVNGDVERWVPPVEDPGVGSSRSTYTGGSLSLRSSVVRVEEETDSDQVCTSREFAEYIYMGLADLIQTEREHEPKGLRKWFGGRAMRKSKRYVPHYPALIIILTIPSVKDLRRVANGTKTPAPLSPPLPNVPRNNIVSATNTTAPRPASTNGKAPVTFSNGKEPVRA